MLYWNLKMGQTYMDGREAFQDEKAIPVNNIVGLEEDYCSGFTASEIRKMFEKMASMQPLVSEVKQPGTCQRCNEKLCPCRNELTFPNFVSLISLEKKLERHCIELVEFRTSGSLRNLCRAASLSLNLRSSEIFFKSLKQRRRTRSTNDLGNFIVEYASAAGTGNVIVSPSGPWIFDSIERTVKARSLLKSSLLFQLGTIDSNMSQIGASPVDSRETKSSELTSSLSGLSNSSLQNPNAEVMLLEEQRPESRISGIKLSSCSSISSTCSYQSTSSEHSSFSKGLLHCVWKSGIPHFLFSVDNHPGKIYLANPQKIESSDDKSLDYLYLFHSRMVSKKESGNFGNSASAFVGKMKVSTSLLLTSNRSKIMETEFVLFGASEDNSREMKNSTSTLTISKGLHKKVQKIFRASTSSKHKSTHKIDEPSSQFEDALRERCLNELSNLEESSPVNLLESDFQPNLELAAIVVKDYTQDISKEVTVGGWGLKFLKEVDHADASAAVSHCSESCLENCTRNSRESTRSMNVLVPAGFHSGPITRSGGGPSSLTERWRNGGRCDCGGWDIGCPLTVLDNYSNSKVLPLEESQEDCKSVKLFTEGAKQGEPTLKMVNMNEGLHCIYFQSTLSPLQSFSIGVAIIHAQTPALSPKL